jgi:hypothetical protein
MIQQTRVYKVIIGRVECGYRQRPSAAIDSHCSDLGVGVIYPIMLIDATLYK